MRVPYSRYLVIRPALLAAEDRLQTYILAQQVSTSIIILEDANITALEVERPEAADILILTTDAVACRNTDFGILVVGRVDVEVQNVFSSGIVLGDLGSLNDAVGTEVTGFLGSSQEAPLEAPLNQVRGRVAVDCLERSTVCLLLANHVVNTILLTASC